MHPGTEANIQGGSLERHADSGIIIQDGAALSLKGTRIASCKPCGVMLIGHGSAAVMETVKVSDAANGVVCRDGARMGLVDSEVSSCEECGVLIAELDSQALIQGGSIQRAQNGVVCVNGASSSVRRVAVAQCAEHGLVVHDGGVLDHTDVTFEACALGNTLNC